jgi:hypothetical protein
MVWKTYELQLFLSKIGTSCASRYSIPALLAAALIIHHVHLEANIPVMTYASVKEAQYQAYEYMNILC